MKDVSPERQNGKLPTCPFSTQYERLLEDLDTVSTTLYNEEAYFELSGLDRELVQQLQRHQQECATCSVVLARARARRHWQRQQLRRCLNEGEQEVPSTIPQIIQALARESRLSPHAQVEYQIYAEGHEENIQADSSDNFHYKPTQKRSRKLLQQVLTLVAVLVLLLTSLNLFSHLHFFHVSPTGSFLALQKKSIAFSVLHATTWTSVVMAVRAGRQKIITSTDPLTGNSAVLASSDYPDGTTLDSISHDGYQVLYHVYDGSKTRYYLQPSSGTAALYTVAGKGGQAIWSTDDSSLFISLPTGIEEFNMKSHQATLVASSLNAPDLRFYRNGYLYFATSSDTGTTTWLDRIELASGDVVPVTAAGCAFSYDFWPSPGGASVYYRCKDQDALYRIGTDGTGASTLRSAAGRIIGYTAQGAPLTLVKQGTAFQVVQLDVNTQHDQTVVSDVAPGASDLSADTIAVAPYGFSLLALARYVGGTEKLWYNDLVQHTHTVVFPSFDLSQTSAPQLAGWSRLRIVPSAASTPSTPSR